MKKAISGKRLKVNRGVVLCAILAAVLADAHAQQPNQVSRLGFLAVAPLSSLEQRTEAFRQGMRELGYAEGKNIFIDWRSAEGIQGRESKLAAELVRLKVDVHRYGWFKSNTIRKSSNKYDPHCHGARPRSGCEWFKSGRV